MTIIRPITDLRSTNAISELCHQSKEPVFITKNGYGDMVIMSMDTYEKMTAQLQALTAAAAATPVGFAVPQPEAAMAQNSQASVPPLSQAAPCPPFAAGAVPARFTASAAAEKENEEGGEEDFDGLRAIREKYRKTKTGPVGL